MRNVDEQMQRGDAIKDHMHHRRGSARIHDTCAIYPGLSLRIGVERWTRRWSPKIDPPTKTSKMYYIV